jgi:hypothetical protein
MKSESLVSRLRSRLLPVTKPGAVPFDCPAGGIIQSSRHPSAPPLKAGDFAGFASINVNMFAAGGTPSQFKMIEQIYIVDPLCEEAAAELERLSSMKPDAP